MTINYQRNPPCVCGIFSLLRPGPVVMLSRRVQVCKKKEPVASRAPRNTALHFLDGTCRGAGWIFLIQPVRLGSCFPVLSAKNAERGIQTGPWPGVGVFVMEERCLAMCPCFMGRYLPSEAAALARFLLRLSVNHELPFQRSQIGDHRIHILGREAMPESRLLDFDRRHFFCACRDNRPQFNIRLALHHRAVQPGNGQTEVVICFRVSPASLAVASSAGQFKGGLARRAAIHRQTRE